MSAPDTTLAVQTDTALADLYNAAATLRERIARSELSALQQAGAEFYYRGRRRVTDMRVAQAEAILAADIAAHADDEYGYALVRGGTSIGGIRRTVELLAECREALARVEADMEPLEAVHALHGWSRFFLVTSSAGHVHSSTYCSTCRPTTTYGWLPELSGQDEGAAVEKLGPALCSVCFPSAPVEHVGGKLTKATAAKLAH